MRADEDDGASRGRALFHGKPHRRATYLRAAATTAGVAS